MMFQSFRRWARGAHSGPLGARCLDVLERCVLRSRLLQAFVLERHERALRRLLPTVRRALGGEPRNVGIVGGGLFPRTAILLRRILPRARLTIIDLNPGSIRSARERLGSAVQYRNERFGPSQRSEFDLLILPLALLGDREAICASPPAPALLVHDWIFRRRQESEIVSLLLLKRLNFVAQGPPLASLEPAGRGARSTLQALLLR